MKNKNKNYNLEQIVSISYFDKKENRNYKYLEEIKSRFGFIKRYAGFYGLWFRNYTQYRTNEYILESKCNMIENNVVYLRPVIEIDYSNKKTQKIYFDSYDEMIKAYNEIIKNNKINWLKY